MKLWVLVVAALTLGGCSSSEHPPIALSFTAMGTLGEVLLPADSAAEAECALHTTRASIEAIEADFSIYRPTSLVSRLNHGESIHLSPSQVRLFSLADDLVSFSAGAFDPTIGPLMHLWGFRGGTPSPPSTNALHQTLALTGWHRVLSLSNYTARLSIPNAKLDFGGLAKGFAVDSAFNATSASNILINLGGNMRARGTPRPHAHSWTIAIRNPFSPNPTDAIGTLSLTSGMAVATSGNYEQFVEFNGLHYTHILDPRSGFPTRGLAQVTIVAPTAALADGLSTACFILGPQASLPLLEQYPQTSAFFIPDEAHGGLHSAIELGAPFPWSLHP